MIEPKWSIVVPNYNFGHYLGECLDSVITQEYSNWELWVYDNASTDNSVEVVQEYMDKDPRIKLIVSPQNTGGPTHGINDVLLNYASGEFAFWLCSDDKLCPNYFKTILPYFTGPEIGFVRIGLLIFPEDPNLWPHEEKFFKPTPWVNMLHIFQQNKVFSSSPFRLSVFKEVRGIDDPAPYFDWDFWIKVVLAGYQWRTCPYPLAARREHAKNASKTDDLKGMAKELVEKYKNVLDKYDIERVK